MRALHGFSRVGKQVGFIPLFILVLALWLGTVSETAYAQEAPLQPSDLNQNGIPDSEEAEVVVAVSTTLPAGEYRFNTLAIPAGVTLTLRGDPSAPGFQGVRIRADNLIVEPSAIISANEQGYPARQGPGAMLEFGGASYGGAGAGQTAASTYGSAMRPVDLGSGGLRAGGGAIHLVISNELLNDGTVSANGRNEGGSSGGSILVEAGSISGAGVFSARGGTGWFIVVGSGPGGGGRVALHASQLDFRGAIDVSAPCSSGSCAQSGTAGIINTTENTLVVVNSWRFEVEDSPFAFSRVIATGAYVGMRSGVALSAGKFVLENSSASFAEGAEIFLSRIALTNSHLTLSGLEELFLGDISLEGNSVITVPPERVLNLTAGNLTIASGSRLDADRKGYGKNSGPGAPGELVAGASHGGVGRGNTATSTYGSAEEPTDFGSGGISLQANFTSGGGAIKLTISGTFHNDGVVTANGGHLASGGSILVRTGLLSGQGAFSARGGGISTLDSHVVPGGGGRIALYSGISAFTGTVTVEKFCNHWVGSIICGGDGSLVIGELEPPKPDPVVIIPGILGSDQKNGEWVLDPLLHTYDDLVATLEANGYVVGVDLFPFPYDWRESNVHTAALLKQKIDEILEICACGKVDIVAHSMGGLAARHYIQSDAYGGDVDQLIFLGTPHLGAPKAYLMWEGGDSKISLIDPEGSIMNFMFKSEARKNGYSDVFNYIHGRPVLSVLELLPIYSYLFESNNNILREYPNNYPRNVFLERLKESAGILLERTRLENVVGLVSDDTTVTGYIVKESFKLPKWEHGEPTTILREGGDETVPFVSSVSIAPTHTTLNVNHTKLPSSAAGLVFTILTNAEPLVVVDNGINLNLGLLVIKLLSPIDVQIIAPDGKRIGKNFETGGEYDEIPLAFYSGFETDNEFISILDPLDGEYRIIVEGTNEGGKYAIAVGYFTDDEFVEVEFAGATAPNVVREMGLALDSESVENIKFAITKADIIADIEMAYSVGWIKNHGIRNSLLDKVNKGEYQDFLNQLEAQKGKHVHMNAYTLLKEDINWLLR